LSLVGLMIGGVLSELIVFHLDKARWLGRELMNALLGRTTYQSPLCPRKRPSATAAQHVVMGQQET
jgi:hypothetical protein